MDGRCKHDCFSSLGIHARWEMELWPWKVVMSKLQLLMMLSANDRCSCQKSFAFPIWQKYVSKFNCFNVFKLNCVSFFIKFISVLESSCARPGKPQWWDSLSLSHFPQCLPQCHLWHPLGLRLPQCHLWHPLGLRLPQCHLSLSATKRVHCATTTAWLSTSHLDCEPFKWKHGYDYA